MATVILPHTTTTTTTLTPTPTNLPTTPDHTSSKTTTTTTPRTRSPHSLKNIPTTTTTTTIINNNNNNNKNNKENNNTSNCCSSNNSDTLQPPRASCRRSPKKKNYLNIKDSSNNSSIRSNSISRNSYSSSSSSSSNSSSAGRNSCGSSSSSSSCSSSNSTTSSSSCSSSSSSSSIQGLRFHPRAASVHCAQQRRTAFSRSRSLSECRPPWPTREGGPTEERTEAQSRFCRVRSFKSTRKGLVRDGESYKSTDTKTFMSTGSVRVYRKLNAIGRSESIDSTDSSVGGSSVAESYYRVCVLGAPGVGKSTLIRKFLTSEEHSDSSCNAGDTSRTRAVTVSVLLDGQESLLEFWNHSQEEEDEGEMAASRRSLDTSTTTLTSSNQASDDVSDDVADSVADDVGGDDVFDSSLSQGDAYTIVFAVNDLDSFRRAESFLRHLREERGTDRAITLVGNKSDLVRQRRVLNKDACILAHRYDCKYIETSAVLGHQTDELLVGTLRQIRLKLSTSRDKEKPDDVKTTNRKYVKWQKIIHLYRFLHGASQSVDSCQNFFV